MPENMPDRMPEDMPEGMSGRMPEDMPNRMREDMSDRMPEDLPITKRINVMVGITRSKVTVFILGLGVCGNRGAGAMFSIIFAAICNLRYYKCCC